MAGANQKSLLKTARAIVEIGVVAAFLVSGILPGLDTYVVLLLGWASLRLRRLGWRELGLRRPSRPLQHIAAGLVLGSIWAPLDIFFVEPMVGRAMGKSVDLARLHSIAGNTGNYVIMLLVVWMLIAWAEELTYRGYLLNRCADVLGRNVLGWVTSLLIVSAIFGFAHAYQGPAGIITTGYVSLVLGGLYLLAGKNLWLPIFAHGAYDTVGLTLIFLNKYPA